MIPGIVHTMQVFMVVAGCNCAADKVAPAPGWGNAQAVVAREQGRPAIAEGGTVTIDRAACRFLIKHQPRADVTYQPGVDISGRAVAPADLEDRVDLQLPETLTIDITPELTKWLPNTNPPYDRLSNSKINIGTIALSGDSITMNGQPLSPGAQENLAILCLQQTR